MPKDPDPQDPMGAELSAVFGRVSLSKASVVTKVQRFAEEANQPLRVTLMMCIGVGAMLSQPGALRVGRQNDYQIKGLRRQTSKNGEAV